MKVLISVRLILFCLFLSSSLQGSEEPSEIRLWTGKAPGSEKEASPEKTRVTAEGERVVSSVHVPSLTPYLPLMENATGVGVIIAPGGGHRELWMDHEGYGLARVLRDQGIAAFVLKYRLAREVDSPYSIEEHAVEDLRRSVRMVRSRGQEWGVDPERVGVLGFSAGGELVMSLGIGFDGGDPASCDPVEKMSCRPNFQAFIYPGGSGRYAPVSEVPPTFIVCGFKDRKDIAYGMAEVYLKLKDLGVPTELHIYSEAGHGFGVRSRNQSASGRWPERFLDWLRDRKVLNP